IYQPEGKLQQTRDALEAALELIKPGPMDSEIDNKLVIENYVRLADVYEKLNDPIREIAALEKEFGVAVFLKDDDLSKLVASILRQKIEALHIEQLIDDSYKTGKLQDALEYSEILDVYTGGAKSDNNQYWNVLTQVPFQLVNQPGGAEFLKSNLDLLGSVLGVGKIPILQALADHYLNTNQPQIAGDFASNAVSFIEKSTTGLDSVKVRALCTLAVATARSGHSQAGIDHVNDCINLATKIGDPESLKVANAANVMVHLATNDIGAAQESLTYLLKNAPSDAVIHEDLAIALAANGHFQEGKSELNIAIRVFEAKADKASMAQAYTQMQISLATNQSEKATHERLAYVESSMNLFKELGDLRGQAGAAIGIGQCYMRLAQYSDALSNLQMALSIADRLGQGQVTAMALSYLAQAYSASGDRLNAAEFYRRTATAYHTMNDPGNETFALIGLYFDLAAQNKSQDALSILFQAKATAENSSSDLAKLYVQLDL
ncbi:MAG: tetratricopeptide repeat protein, partial [Candidatus Micrarchaeaceae archaeon]